MRTDPVIPTVEEMRKRMKAKDAGKAPESLEVLALKKRIQELESAFKEGAQMPVIGKDTIKKGIVEILERYGVEPAEELIKLLLDVDAEGQFKMTRSERAKWWSELMQYRNSKLRSVEHTGRVDGTLTIAIIKYSTGEVIERKPMQLESQTPEDLRAPIDVEIEKSPI